MARRSRRDERPIPDHPYRDTALVYGILAVVLVGVATLTGGDVTRAALVAVIFFLVATSWTSWKFRTRIRERDAARDSAPPSEPSGGSGGGSTSGNGRRGAGT